MSNIIDIGNLMKFSFSDFRNGMFLSDVENNFRLMFWDCMDERKDQDKPRKFKVKVLVKPHNDQLQHCVMGYELSNITAPKITSLGADFLTILHDKAKGAYFELIKDEQLNLDLLDKDASNSPIMNYDINLDRMHDGQLLLNFKHALGVVAQDCTYHNKSWKAPREIPIEFSCGIIGNRNLDYTQFFVAGKVLSCKLPPFNEDTVDSVSWSTSPGNVINIGYGKVHEKRVKQQDLIADLINE